MVVGVGEERGAEVRGRVGAFGGAGHVVTEACLWGLLRFDADHTLISGVSRQLYAGCTCTSAMEQSTFCLLEQRCTVPPCRALRSERVCKE